MILIAFLGYTLPYGQMSYWGATVISNLIGVIPYIGEEIKEYIWGEKKIRKWDNKKILCFTLYITCSYLTSYPPSYLFYT